MKLVAINSTHNANAGLFEDGVCICIYHEEKFNNIKNYSGIPTISLDYIKEKYGFDDVDLFVFSSNELMTWSEEDASVIDTLGEGFIRRLYNWFDYNIHSKWLFSILRKLLNSTYFIPTGHSLITRKFSERYNVSKDKIIFTDHHTNHCLTPLFFYGPNAFKEKVLLISLDGAGDGYCAKVFKYLPKTKEITLLQKIRYEESIGLLYKELTRYLGFKPMEHEYKVMGLAAYVDEEKYYKNIYEKLNQIIWFDKSSLSIKSKFNTSNSLYFFKKIGKEQRFDNMAAAIQKLTEDLVVEWVEALVKKTNIKNVAVSGGVFMNVKLNQILANSKHINKIHFQPSCGDDSLLIGAAANVFKKKKIELKPIQSMFLGHSYSNDEVNTYLKKNKLFSKYSIVYYKDIEEEIAKKVADFKIVARFKGSGEWGARSLCNRSIMGNASDLKTFYTVNDQIKMRDFWMPFAPTILEEWAPKYIKNWNIYKEKALDSTKYMILAMDSTDLAVKHLRAAIHQKDHTLRPQIVSKKDNADLYKLLKHYEKLTGMGGLLNTSLNLHGYPLVGTLDQAIFTFENSDLQYMALENYMVSKKTTPK